MHILFSTYEFVSGTELCGGLGNYLANISTILAEHGHDVTVLIITDHNSRFWWKKNIEVICFKYQYVKEKGYFGEYIDELLKTTNIASILNKSKAINMQIGQINKYKTIDVVQYCGDDMAVWYRDRSIASVIRYSSFARWLYWASIDGSDMRDTSWLKDWESRFFLLSLLRADAVYGPSKVVAEFIKKCLPIHVKIIESPFLLEEIGETQLMEQLIDKKYLLYFGKLCILKGIGVITSAIHEILDKNRDLSFVFMGWDIEGWQTKILNAAGENRDRVIFLGNITNRHIKSGVIKNAIGCVMPSRADNLPNTCIEVMGLGKIVIGTYGASLDQLITDKNNGLLVQRDSPKELVEAVRYLMKMSENDREKMGYNAKKRIQRMEPEIIYKELIEFYTKVLKKRAKKVR